MRGSAGGRAIRRGLICAGVSALLFACPGFAQEPDVPYSVETESETDGSDRQAALIVDADPARETEQAAILPEETRTDLPEETEFEQPAETESGQPEETESELQEGFAEAVQTATLQVVVNPSAANGFYPDCYVTLERTDGGASSEEAAVRTVEGVYGSAIAVDGLAFGATYRLAAHMPHYSDSAPFTVQVDEEGNISVNGTVRTRLDITLYVANYLSKSQLTPISLTQLNKIARTSALEGGTATGSFLVSAFVATGTNRNKLALLNLTDYRLIKTMTAQTALVHANDMTYVAPAGQIYVTPMDGTNRVVILDAGTLNTVAERTLGQDYHAIAYDDASGCFFCVYEGKKGIVCDVLNTQLTQVLRSFPILTNLTYQGAAAYNSLLYYTCWERGSTNRYQSVYDGVLNANDNVIYVYDLYGNLRKTYYIAGGSSKFELETLSFVDGRMVLQFNEAGNKAGYYRVDPVAAAVTLSVPVTQNGAPAPDKAYQAALTQNGKSLATLKSAGGAFTKINISIKEPGVYTYVLKEKKGSDTAGYVYDTEKVTFTVTAAYDPYTNGLTVKSSGPSRAAIANTKLTAKQKKNRAAFEKKVPSFTKAQGKKRKVKLRWGKVKFGSKKAQGYEVQICRKKSFSGPTLQTFRVSGTKKNISGLLRKKKYYVRVRAFYTVGTGTFCTKYSAAKKVKTK